MARPRKTMAQKVAENAHISNEEKAAGLKNEVFAADGDISPPKWLKGPAREHFLKMTAYMKRKNALAKASIYGSIDTEAVAMMCVSYQRSLEALKEENEANTPEDKGRAQRKRLAENKNYRDFMTKLQLDPMSRPFLPESNGDGHVEDDTADV